MSGRRWHDDRVGDRRDRRHFIQRAVKIGEQRDGYRQILDGVKVGELAAT